MPNFERQIMAKIEKLDKAMNKKIQMRPMIPAEVIIPSDNFIRVLKHLEDTFDNLMMGFIQEYIKEHVAPAFNALLGGKQTSDYYPWFRITRKHEVAPSEHSTAQGHEEGLTTTQEHKSANWEAPQRGLDLIHELLSKPDFNISLNQTGEINWGLKWDWNRILNLRSEQFMPIAGEGHTSSSALHSWFYNVEFGTGTAKNIGTAAYLNTEGENKNPDGNGEWSMMPWDATNPPNIQFKGQKGWHVFFDEQTRKPNEFWVNIFGKDFYEFLRTKLGDMITNGS